MSKSLNPTKEVIPIMKKRIYRRMPVNDFHPETISPAELGGKLVFAIDVPQGLVSDPDSETRQSGWGEEGNVGLP
jgi:hypothetical protein